jgi:hypothetical protein
LIDDPEEQERLRIHCSVTCPATPDGLRKFFPSVRDEQLQITSMVSLQNCHAYALELLTWFEPGAAFSELWPANVPRSWHLAPWLQAVQEVLGKRWQIPETVELAIWDSGCYVTHMARRSPVDPRFWDSKLGRGGWFLYMHTIAQLNGDLFGTGRIYEFTRGRFSRVSIEP